MISTDPDSKLPHIQNYSQPMSLVYKKLGSIVDEDHCNHNYHDLLERGDPEKWDRAVRIATEQFPTMEHGLTANFFQVVLCEYFGTFVEISGIYTGVNRSNGYQYWVFATPKKSKTLEVKSKIEPISRQSEPDDSLNVLSGFITLFMLIPLIFWIFNLLELGPATMKIYNDFNQKVKEEAKQ